MKTPSFLISYKDGEPVVELCSMDADKVKKAYRASDQAVQLFLKPGLTQSKRGLVSIPAPKKVAAKKAGRPKKA